MGKLDYVTVNFKNLEKVVIEPKDVIALELEGITTTVKSYGEDIIEKREEADYVLLQVEKFESDRSNELSVLYSDVKPFERLSLDKTAVSVELHYSDGKCEEIYVPYLNKTPKTVGENELLDISEKVVEVPYFEPRVGVELSFNNEGKLE